jgi:hypothetical protein
MRSTIVTNTIVSWNHYWHSKYSNIPLWYRNSFLPFVFEHKALIFFRLMLTFRWNVLRELICCKMMTHVARVAVTQWKLRHTSFANVSKICKLNYFNLSRVYRIIHPTRIWCTRQQARLTYAPSISVSRFRGNIGPRQIWPIYLCYTSQLLLQIHFFVSHHSAVWSNAAKVLTANKLRLF